MTLKIEIMEESILNESRQYQRKS